MNSKDRESLMNKNSDIFQDLSQLDFNRNNKVARRNTTFAEHNEYVNVDKLVVQKSFKDNDSKPSIINSQIDWKLKNIARKSCNNSNFIHDRINPVDNKKISKESNLPTIEEDCSKLNDYEQSI